MGFFTPSCPYCGSDNTERTNLDEKIGEAVKRGIARGAVTFIGGMFIPNFRLPPGPKSQITTEFICNRCGSTWKKGDEDYIRQRKEELRRQEQQRQKELQQQHLAEIRSKYKLEDVLTEMVKVKGSMNIPDFYIGKYPVTQVLWLVVMGYNPSHFEGILNPVENVSWYDCQNFIKELNSLTGRKFRLPTESEWEFAARGGNKTHNYTYSGSNYLDEVGWYKNNSGGCTHPVGQKKPNELDIYDMSGNVWEWCEDKNEFSLGNIICGGSWSNDNSNSAVSCRFNYPPDVRFRNRGVRIAMDA